MGCGGLNSEFDCVNYLGQAAANSAFQNHWATWITQSDILQMQSYGLNAIRIPVGYWMREDIVYADSEHFPQGGLKYLEQVCGWDADAGFYIIIDLHGAPGAQVIENADIGQYASSAGFYVDSQYERALKFLEWMATNIHSKLRYCPVHETSYYPNAFSRIRAAETALGITSANYLHIQMMNKKWGSGDPTQYLTDNYFAAYDDNRYIKWDSSVAVSQSSYLSESCHDDRGGNWPTIVGEFSLSVPDDVQWTSGWDPSSNVAFYKQWFAAQAMSYENQQGWILWNWKSQLGDYRWSYQDAVGAGVIPSNPGDVYNEGACNGY